MGRLCCGCLNVKLHTKKPLPEPLSPEQLDSGIASLDCDDFFSLPIAEVQLDLEGVRIEQQCLMRQREAGDWTIHECVNCELQTHAIHAKQGTNKVLINTSLKSDPTILERLEKSSEYSPIYKVILHSRNDNFAASARNLSVQSERYEHIQQHLNATQQSLNRFLKDEQNAMEERIRAFEEQQRSGLAELQSKARRDKNTMITLIMSTEERDSDSDLMTDSPVSPLNPNINKASLDVADDSMSEMHRYLQRVNLPDLKSQPFKKPSSNFQRSASVASRPSHFHAEQQDIADPLFDMDGVDFDDSRPFYHSDEESESTDDSTPEDSGMHYSSSRHRSSHHKRSILSSSVPISVPRWHHGPPMPVQPGLQEDSTVPAPDPEDMAASIKALARSVHGDGSEMFGERPRPRLNTLDIGNL